MLIRAACRPESVLAVRHMGIQLSSQLCLRVAGIDLPISGQATTFVPLSAVQDVLILEGIHGWSVIYYLAVLQDDGDGVRIHVVFRVRAQLSISHMLTHCPLICVLPPAECAAAPGGAYTSPKGHQADLVWLVIAERAPTCSNRRTDSVPGEDDDNDTMLQHLALRCVPSTSLPEPSTPAFHSLSRRVR